jgi:thioesterase domain-containing protein/acyl carrier protein
MKNLLERQPDGAMVCVLTPKEPDLSNGVVETKIRNFIARNFLYSEGEPDFDNEASFVQEGIVDSLGVIELVTFARNQFGIEVNPADVTPPNFDSVTRMAAFIRRKRVLSSPAGAASVPANGDGTSAISQHTEANGSAGSHEPLVARVALVASGHVNGSHTRETTEALQAFEVQNTRGSVPMPLAGQASRQGGSPRIRPDKDSSLVEIQASGDKAPLFLVHGVGGGMFWGYSNLARHLGPGQPVYAFKCLENSGFGKNTSVEQMAAQYVEDLIEFQPVGPYLLGGYCFGGNVAYEMARQLKAKGKEIGLLLLINCWPNNSSYTQLQWTPGFLAKAVFNFVLRMRHQIRSGSKRPRDYFQWRAKWASKRLKALFSRNSTDHLLVDDFVDLSGLLENERELWRAHVQAWLEYKPGPYSGHIVLFRTRGHPLLCSFDHEMGWGSFAAEGVTVRICPGDHESILEEENVGTISRELEVVLTKAAVPRVMIEHRGAELAGTSTLGQLPV